MDDQPERDVMYTVSRVANGQWGVQQSGFKEPLAFFREQDDAVEYARRLAGTKISADVEIIGRE